MDWQYPATSHTRNNHAWLGLLGVQVHSIGTVQYALVQSVAHALCTRILVCTKQSVAVRHEAATKKAGGIASCFFMTVVAHRSG